MLNLDKRDSDYIWLDGNLVKFEDAQVHVLSHSLHYGSAAFEGIRAYRTVEGKAAIFRGPEHFERFLRSIQFLSATCEWSVEKLMKASHDVISANKFDECYIRPVAFFGNGTRGLNLPLGLNIHVAIAIWKWGKYLGDSSQNTGVKTIISSFRRPDIASSLPWAKVSGNYLNSILARREAAQHGADEAILLDQDGLISEGSGENIFIVEHGKILTPYKHAVLPGITRDTIIELAQELKLSIEEAPISRNRLYAADEAFFTGTAVEVTPIREVDGRIIGKGRPGEITQQFMSLFNLVVTGRHKYSKRWLG